MTTSHEWAHGRLQELDTAECLELVAAKSVGRVAVCTEDGPVVLPVNFVLSNGGVMFRTSPHNSIAQELNGRPAAFEVDEVDDFTRSGWSVLFRGIAEYVEEVRDLPEDERPEPWAQGTRSLFVRIRARSITGRRVFPS